jgi:hypothetical protein
MRSASPRTNSSANAPASFYLVFDEAHSKRRVRRETKGSPRSRWVARIVREEWLFDATELRAQQAAFGRLGGHKGGRARAERLSPERRREIAKQAAAAPLTPRTYT